MKYLLCISYDGSKYYGSQIQKDKVTVLGQMTKVISKIYKCNIKLLASSRTDRGVHAKEQYVTFETNNIIEGINIPAAINSLIDKSIYVKSCRVVNDKFNVRYDVEKKEYVYKINVKEYNPIEKDYCLQYNNYINLKLIRKASKYLVGVHDFRSFTTEPKENSIRDIKYIKIKKIGNYVYIYICADGFLKYMIRNIIGLFLEINEGKKSVNDINYIIDARDRTVASRCEKSCGLYLNKIIFK